MLRKWMVDGFRAGREDAESGRLWVVCRKTPSAMGERHMFPRQTNITETLVGVEAGPALWASVEAMLCGLSRALFNCGALDVREREREEWWNGR